MYSTLGLESLDVGSGMYPQLAVIEGILSALLLVALQIYSCLTVKQLHIELTIK